MSDEQFRPRTRFVRLCEPDEQIAVINGRMLIVSPDKPPRYLNSDGTFESMDMTSSSACIR